MVGTWGLSGIAFFMTLTLLNSKNPNDPRNAAPPSGSPGKYKVRFILSRPGYSPLAENHISFDDAQIRGDSHFLIGKSNGFVDIEAPLAEGTITLRGYPNDKGFLGKIEVEKIEALSFGDANLKAYNALSTALSRLSLVADMPLHIYKLTTIELSTQNLMSSATLPFLEKSLATSAAFEADKDLSRFSSLYREALNSNSPNYQYLSFFKIIEGIRRIPEERTTQENQAALAKDEKPPSRPCEKLPTTREEKVAWLNSVIAVACV
ncbi:MAG: methylamine utilization protein MauJ [Pyrinomonadaceae bacterium]